MEILVIRLRVLWKHNTKSNMFYISVSDELTESNNAQGYASITIIKVISQIKHDFVGVIC